jgi:hypothetical protein
MPPMPLRRLILLAAAAVLLLAAAGCADRETTSNEGTTAEPVLKADVSKSQISTYPAGSAERTVLGWWRDVQLNDPEPARQYYAEPPTLPDLAGQFNYVQGQLAGKVKVSSVEEKKGKALVRVEWSQPEGATQEVTLRLSKKGSGWVLLDTRFLDEIVAKLQREEAGG